MPRLRLDDNGDVPYHRCGTTGNGLRNKQSTYADETVPHTQRDRDDRFDMYRNDVSGTNRQAADPKTKVSRGPRQLWFAACLVCALGAFCIFADSVTIEMMGVPVRLASFEVLLGSADYSIPAQIVYISAMPIAFLIMSAVFACLKEDTFDKAWLALIAVSVLAIILLINWCTELPDYGAYSVNEILPGYGVFIQIGSAVGLIIVIACQRILGTVAGKKDRW